jgi:hypothetical protein
MYALSILSYSFKSFKSQATSLNVNCDPLNPIVFLFAIKIQLSTNVLSLLFLIVSIK